VTSVIGVLERDDHRWVFLDAGVFSGLAETLGEAIRYHVSLVGGAVNEPAGPAVLAGPTCDSADIMYERHPVDLPLSLAVGDRLRFGAAGAYTTSYATRFNGFPELGMVVSGARVGERLTAVA